MIINKIRTEEKGQISVHAAGSRLFLSFPFIVSPAQKARDVLFGRARNRVRHPNFHASRGWSPCDFVLSVSALVSHLQNFFSKAVSIGIDDPVV